MPLAHILYECLTNAAWGMGYPSASIDDASFRAAADTLAAEGFGLNLIWLQQSKIEQFVREVLDHIGGVLTTSPSTGRFVLKLVRADYAVANGQETFGRASRRAWRGPALLLLMLLIAGFAAYLALINKGPADDPLTGAFESYLVDVSVSPANLPPVQLVVDQSPPGSNSRPGTVMAAVPRSVTFDAAGRWVVHGRFQGRETPPVTLDVPSDTAITLSFPAPGQ